MGKRTLTFFYPYELCRIDTDSGVCYLHLITDAFTHEIIGYTVSDTLMATNTLAALNQAIEHAGDINLCGVFHGIYFEIKSNFINFGMRE
jgi:hypothetical protein